MHFTQSLQSILLYVSSPNLMTVIQNWYVENSHHNIIINVIHIVQHILQGLFLVSMAMSVEDVMFDKILKLVLLQVEDTILISVEFVMSCHTKKIKMSFISHCKPAWNVTLTELKQNPSPVWFWDTIMMVKCPKNKITTVSPLLVHSSCMSLCLENKYGFLVFVWLLNLQPHSPGSVLRPLTLNYPVIFSRLQTVPSVDSPFSQNHCFDKQWFLGFRTLQKMKVYFMPNNLSAIKATELVLWAVLVKINFHFACCPFKQSNWVLTLLLIVLSSALWKSKTETYLCKC